VNIEDLPDLHDATFQSVVLLWNKDARAELHFRLDHRTITVTASGVTNLACPHENPWGPSVSVNALRGPSEVGDGVRRIEIEIQSGDTIRVEASGFGWETDQA
jgi:hypothetical protein